MEKGTEAYKKQIIEEVQHIDNLWILKQIWFMIQNIQR